MNLLTIDIEDYFQVHAFSNVVKYEDWDKFESRIERNIDRILQLLNYKHKATFFVLGWVAERYPNIIKKLHKEGHEIACHGYAHRLIYRYSQKEFREDIRRSKAILEDIIGDEVVGYRAPSYSITKNSLWALEILIEEGFKYDSSIFPIHHDFYGIPDAPRFPFIVSLNGNSSFEFSILNFKLNNVTIINNQTFLLSNSTTAVLPYNFKTSTLNNSIIEFPLSTTKILGRNLPICGGGYFRLFPYHFIKKGLKSINEKENKPFIFYLHPWELDPKQPRINNISFRSKFRHYINLDKTEKKFKLLLKDFKFSSIKDFLYCKS